MPDVEDQLRRYGAAVERSASERGTDVRDLSVTNPAPPHRALRWLAAAAALLVVAGAAAAVTIDDDVDRIRTADDGAEDPAPEAPSAPEAELDCGPDGLASSGSLLVGTDESGRVPGAEPTPEAAFRRFVEEWTLVRYPAVDEVHDGGDDPQPGYNLEPAAGTGRRSVTYRLPDLRVVGTFGLAEVNDGEGWIVDATGSCYEWSRTLPLGNP